MSSLARDPERWCYCTSFCPAVKFSSKEILSNLMLNTVVPQWASVVGSGRQVPETMGIKQLILAEKGNEL